MILKHHVTIFGLILLYSVCGFAAPHDIDKPASEIPVNAAVELNHVNHQDAFDLIDESKVEKPGAKKIGSARSRVIPRGNIAVIESKKTDVKKADVAPATIAPGDVSRLIKKMPTPQNVKVKKTVESTKNAKAQPLPKIEKNPDSEPKNNPVDLDVNNAPTVAADSPAENDTKTLNIEDVAVAKETYRYASKNKSDPFIPPIGEVRSGKTLKPIDADEIPIVSPLQYFSLSQLAVTGVWQASDNSWKAMVETPDQQGIVAAVGDPIGNSGGHIVNVGGNGLKVREYTLQTDGSRRYKDTIVGMAPEVGDQPTGGKIILKPGIESPEVRRDELEKKNLDENGNPLLNLTKSQDDIMVTPTGIAPQNQYQEKAPSPGNFNSKSDAMVLPKDPTRAQEVVIKPEPVRVVPDQTVKMNPTPVPMPTMPSLAPNVIPSGGF